MTFGGFTKQSWEGSGNWKTDTEAFVFSVNNRKKYPISDSGKAIYGDSSHGP